MTVFAFGAKCGLPSGGDHTGSFARNAIAMQHRAERQAGEAQADVGKKRAARSMEHELLCSPFTLRAGSQEVRFARRRVSTNTRLPSLEGRRNDASLLISPSQSRCD